MRRIFNELALLLIPTSVVTLFCQFIGVSQRETAAYSLATVLFVACCLHRSWINSRVPSALVLAICIGLVAIFYFNYEDILLKDTGLIERFKASADFQARVGSEIEAAKDEIWFFGTNFHISAVDRRRTILDKLARGARVRYLILNPYIATFGQIAADFDQPPNELWDECIKGLRDLLELRRQWVVRARSTAQPGELEIRTLKSTPRARLYVFDPARHSGRTMFIPYMNGVNSPELPGYLLQNTETGVFRSYFDGIRKLWNASPGVDELLQAHPELR
ncbi:MAG: hypothetical protein FJW37_08250 [Acidobacteria bacterium]|nr:hypothetical protein [Acidobacteriota bacterium]